VVVYSFFLLPAEFKNASRPKESLMNEKKIVLVSLLVVLFLGSSGTVTNTCSGERVDHRLYAELLKKYVRKGLVDYHGFKNDETKLDQYLKILARTDTKALSRDEQFAFYINAYNAWTIKLILGNYPGVKSIKELGGRFNNPWEKKICHIDGDLLSLDHIEHNILRPRYKDPRVHFAVNCASKSCPPLKPEPFMGASLNRQLEESAIAFINNPSFNRLKGDTLYVSKIFEWFAGDFSKDITGYFIKYALGDLRTRLETRRDKIKVKFLDYDWSLNGE